MHLLQPLCKEIGAALNLHPNDKEDFTDTQHCYFLEAASLISLLLQETLSPYVTISFQFIMSLRNQRAAFLNGALQH